MGSRESDIANSLLPISQLPVLSPQPLLKGCLEETAREVIGWVSGNCTPLRITDHLETLLRDPSTGGRREGGRMPTPATEERFTVEIGWSESIEAYVARVPDIPELVAWDETQEGALKKVRKAIRTNIKMAQEFGDPVAEPSDH
jgi:hypothetical protein